MEAEEQDKQLSYLQGCVSDVREFCRKADARRGYAEKYFGDDVPHCRYAYYHASTTEALEASLLLVARLYAAACQAFHHPVRDKPPSNVAMLVRPDHQSSAGQEVVLFTDHDLALAREFAKPVREDRRKAPAYTECLKALLEDTGVARVHRTQRTKRLIMDRMPVVNDPLRPTAVRNFAGQLAERMEANDDANTNGGELARSWTSVAHMMCFAAQRVAGRDDYDCVELPCAGRTTPVPSVLPEKRSSVLRLVGDHLDEDKDLYAWWTDGGQNPDEQQAELLDLYQRVASFTSYSSYDVYALCDEPTFLDPNPAAAGSASAAPLAALPAAPPAAHKPARAKKKRKATSLETSKVTEVAGEVLHVPTSDSFPTCIGTLIPDDTAAVDGVASDTVPRSAAKRERLLQRLQPHYQTLQAQLRARLETLFGKRGMSVGKGGKWKVGTIDVFMIAPWDDSKASPRDLSGDLVELTVGENDVSPHFKFKLLLRASSEVAPGSGAVSYVMDLFVCAQYKKSIAKQVRANLDDWMWVKGLVAMIMTEQDMLGDDRADDGRLAKLREMTSLNAQFDKTVDSKSGSELLPIEWGQGSLPAWHARYEATPNGEWVVRTSELVRDWSDRKTIELPSSSGGCCHEEDWSSFIRAKRVLGQAAK